MKKALRFTALVGALSIALTGGVGVQKAWAGENCHIWCDNGFVVSGDSSSFEDCQASFFANCNQAGTYGGTFCYSGSPCQTY